MNESNPYSSPQVQDQTAVELATTNTTRGFLYVCACVGTMVTISVCVALLTGNVNFVRFGLTLILSYFLLKGHGWARVVILVLLTPALLLLVYALTVRVNAYAVILLVVYAVIAATLAFSPSVHQFFKQESLKRRRTKSLYQRIQQPDGVGEMMQQLDVGDLPVERKSE